MNRQTLQQRLYLSTIGADCRPLALQYGFGLEIAEFSLAENLDRNAQRHVRTVQSQMAGVQRFWFHAPFAELSPAAIDPRVRQITKLRYSQSIATAQMLGIDHLVIHSGFLPLVYFPEWFLERSVEFWKEFLADAPQNITIALENVLEAQPQLLVELVRQVGDPRLGLCLDVGHANTHVSKLPPLQWVAPMAPWLYHVHLHNNAGDMDLHSALGNGNIPMEEVLDTLLSICPSATFTIENQCCEPSVTWLLRHGYLEEL